MSLKKNLLFQTLPSADQVDGIWPYTAGNGGESTMILLRTGEKLALPDCAILTVADVYAAREDKIFRLIGKRYARSVGRKHGSIYPLSPDMTLVGMKYRTPVCSTHQTTMAYINVAHPAYIIDHPHCSRFGAVAFPSGVCMPLLWGKETIGRKLHEGRDAHHLLIAREHWRIRHAEEALIDTEHWKGRAPEPPQNTGQPADEQSASSA